jgi:hypothetical protein
MTSQKYSKYLVWDEIISILKLVDLQKGKFMENTLGNSKKAVLRRQKHPEQTLKMLEVEFRWKTKRLSGEPVHSLHCWRTQTKPIFLTPQFRSIKVKVKETRSTNSFHPQWKT